MLLLSLLIAAYCFAAAWALSTPVPTADNAQLWGNFQPDEFGHASVARYMAEHGTLPPYVLPYDTSVHPPLYHALASLVFRIFAPRFGSPAALLAIRLLTGLCAPGIVYLAYRSARNFTSRSGALLAATFVLLVPMRASLSGGITNENLAALGAAGAFAVLLGGVSGRAGFTPRRLVLLMLWTVVGVGSKLTCLGLLPAAAIALIDAGRRQRRPLSRALWQSSALLAAVAVSLGWWFARNIRLYGDPVRKTAADRLWSGSQPGFEVLSRQKHLTALYYARSLAANGWRSFWGFFDGFGRPMPAWIYILLALLTVVVALGWLRMVRFNAFPAARRRRLLTAVAVVLTHVVYVAAIFFQYNWSHYTPQGRYFFVLLVPFGIAMAMGWKAALPVSVRRWATPSLLTALLALNLWLFYVVPNRLTMEGRPAPARGSL